MRAGDVSTMSYLQVKVDMLLDHVVFERGDTGVIEDHCTREIADFLQKETEFKFEIRSELIACVQEYVDWYNKNVLE